MGMRSGIRQVVLSGACIGLGTLIAVTGFAEDAHPETPKVEKESGMVENGKQVGIEYTLTLDDGTQVDSNVGGQPLFYQHGANQILPALEAALEGLKVGDTKTIALTAEQGYGPVRPEGFQEVDASMIPEEARVAGATLVADDGAGNRRQVRVKEVKEDKVVVDLNHPLAGKALNFAVRVMEVK
jgi:FKBP-type peptidyl-prolyl cis-trans isomerase SlyD